MARDRIGPLVARTKLPNLPGGAPRGRRGAENTVISRKKLKKSKNISQQMRKR
jgi:hypothetical protein